MDAARGGLPDPCGGPQPVKAPPPGNCKPGADARSGKAAAAFLEVVGGVVVAGGIAVLALTTCMVVSCPGATRSARIEWEQRQVEVGAAIQEARGVGANGADPQVAPATGGEQHESGAV